MLSDFRRCRVSHVYGVGYTLGLRFPLRISVRGLGEEGGGFGKGNYICTERRILHIMNVLLSEILHPST